MIASLAAPAMWCEVAEFDPRGLPLRLRWTVPQPTLLGARERGIVLTTAPEQVSDRSLEAIATWRAEIKQRFNPKTAQDYAWWMKRFFVWCQTKGTRLVDVRQNTIEAFFAEMRERYKPNSLRSCYRSLASFFAWAAATYNLENPLPKICKPKAPAHEHLKDPFSDEEVLALLATCSDDTIGRRDRAIICLMAYGGLRTCQVLNADLGDIETREGRLIIRVWGKGHGGKDKLSVLPVPAENALREWLAVRPGALTGPIFTKLSARRKLIKPIRIGQSRIRIMIHSRRFSIGILSPRKTAHSLRHSAITNAIRHGATLFQAMGMAGHEDPRTTMTYYHETGRLQHPAEDLIVYNEGAKEKKTDDQNTTPAH